MEKVLLTIVEADDHKNQRSADYVSAFFIKKNKQNLFAGYSCQHDFPMVKLKHRHPDGSKLLFGGGAVFI